MVTKNYHLPSKGTKIIICGFVNSYDVPGTKPVYTLPKNVFRENRFEYNNRKLAANANKQNLLLQPRKSVINVKVKFTEIVFV